MPAITEEKKQQCLELYRKYFPGLIYESEVESVLKSLWLSNLRAALEQQRLESIGDITEADIQEYKDNYYKKHKDHVSTEIAYNAIRGNRLNGKYWREQVMPYEQQLRLRQELLANMPADQWLAKALKVVANEYQKLVTKSGRTMITDAYTKAYIVRASQWMTAVGQKPWLMLRGGVGTGKTTLAYAVRRAMLEVQQRGMTAVDALTISNSFISTDASKQQDYRQICNAKNLLLDDIGTEPAKVNNFGTPVSPVGELLMARYRSMDKQEMCTIITTNLSDEEIGERYGEKVLSRLMEMCEVIKYDGNQPDYRKQ